MLAGGDLAQNGTHGLAVYACGPADLLEVVPPPPPDRVARDRGRDAVRGAAAARRRRRRGVVRAARQPQGRAHLLRPGDRAGRRSSSVEDDTHGQHQQGGWSQANYQRSVEQEKLTHLQRSLDTLFAHFKRSRFDHLVLGAPDDLAGEVEDRMHPYLRERLAGRHRRSTSRTPAPTRCRPPPPPVVERAAAARGARGARPHGRGRRPRRPRRGRASPT